MSNAPFNIIAHMSYHTGSNPYSANLASVYHRSHVPSQSFSKLLFSQKLWRLWACFNTLIPSHWIEVDIERLLFSLAVKMPNFWGPKIDKRGDQFFYQMSEFCENCNPHSSHHTTAVGEYLVDIWFAEICQMTLIVCFWKSIHAFKKHTSFVWIYSQLQIHTMLYVRLVSV